MKNIRIFYRKIFLFFFFFFFFFVVVVNFSIYLNRRVFVMIKPQWFELPMSGTNSHGPKDIRSIEVSHNEFIGGFAVSFKRPICANLKPLTTNDSYSR